jgi:general secretion pathway protein M
MSLTAWQQLLKARWTTLAAREQRGVLLAGAVLGAALVWFIALAPALRSLKTVAAQSAALGADIDSMQSLQVRAKALQSKPALAPQESLQTLQTAATKLGAAVSLQVVGGQATLTIKKLSALQLGLWLAPQTGPGLNPTEAHLKRDTGSVEPVWSGTLVYRLPVANTP